MTAGSSDRMREIRAPPADYSLRRLDGHINSFEGCRTSACGPNGTTATQSIDKSKRTLRWLAPAPVIDLHIELRGQRSGPLVGSARERIAGRPVIMREHRHRAVVTGAVESVIQLQPQRKPLPLLGYVPRAI